MNNEFDQPDAFEFEDFESNAPELDEFDDEFVDFGDDFNDESLLVRTAILRKNNMVALLCIKSATAGAAICRVDPRENQPAVQLYDDPDAALAWFQRSLRTSKKNGWDIVYDGLPLQG